ncbi:mitochondrial 37S ribosomal protein [Martiniozyma asiatica (nom. inval.)]|nr:mitochondrial 37S ribosomal protein [Martiniozyma asiatica]
MARQNFIGQVVSQGKMHKTIKVRVFTTKFDKSVQKEFQVKKDYLVHDEANICREGDLVRIEATRPLSAHKFFAVAEIKKNKGQQFAKYQQEAKELVKEQEISMAKEFLNRRAISDKNAKSSLYNDLESLSGIIGKNELSSAEIEKVKNLKNKYGITSWIHSPDENADLFKTTVSQLSNKINDLEMDLSVTALLEKALNDESIYKLISDKLEIGSSTKKNIAKNKIRKFLKVNLNNASELKQLGL